MRLMKACLAVVLLALAVPLHPAQSQNVPGNTGGGMSGHAMPDHMAQHHGSGMSGGSSTAPASATDERRAVTLTAAERNFVLGEMRNFLASVEGITTAIAEDKPAEVAKAARSSGMGNRHNVPRELMMKMPPEWRALGMDTHSRFDALAVEADSMGEAKPLLGQLAGILANCNGCHAGYRLVTE